MAGESPDKSEQQQSSGTTRDERDPRLGVFRDPEPDAGSAGTGEDPAPSDAAGEPGEAPEGAESAASPAEDPDGDADTATEGAESALRAAEEPETAPDAPEEASDAPETAEDAEGGEPEPEEGDARLRAAVAAWVSTADDGDEDTGEADAPEEPRVTDSPDEDPAPEPDEKPEAPEKPEAEPEAAEKPEAEPEAAAKPEAEPAEKPEPAAEPKAPVADAKEPAEDESATGRNESATTEPDEAEAPAGDDAPDEETPAAEADAPVDQPTAVFKAPRLPKVDQPTTALKITRSPSGQPLTAEAESLAERTSRFVPLRSDDVRQAPAPRKPESPVAGPPAALSGAERTRQQPMPPRPPLDLLAELTNTPPPPETPVRTAVRRVKIWTPLVILLLIAFAIAQMVRPLPDPSLAMTAKSTYGFEGGAPKLPWPDQGQGYMAATGLGKVDSFGDQKPVPIASVAKAMTAYLVLKSHPLKRGENGPDIKIDAKAEADGKLYTEGESTLNTVKEGEVLTERDALAAIMIPSANNIARLLARWEAGSEKAFVAKMNATADELGMKNTTYTDPSGLTASTVSTAEDLVKLGEKLVEFPALMDITRLPEWKDPSGHTWRNYNTLVPYDGALGIKTGSTSKAGGNLLFAAHKMIDGTDQLIVGAILGQYDDHSIIDEVNRVSKQVMVATLDLLKGATIVRKGDVVGEVDDGMGHTTPVVATKDVKAVGWSGLTVKLELTDDGKAIPHEAVAGTHVGTLTVGEGRSQVKVAVALRSDLAKPSFGDKLTRIG
ncbi:D-alanyl-D-alanine carboxypeptidase [Streptomyces sp. NBC_00441]|uniref:D-alanyl-D-alanine carboxypeptidase n=1 Tax=Streptomyces sp. NBC_00441 TaxID=2975742 RepID=UPI002E2B7B0F|nr:serine hydrolase [Streptomyces sp. NBC_00441]